MTKAQVLATLKSLPLYQYSQVLGQEVWTTLVSGRRYYVRKGSSTHYLGRRMAPLLLANTK